MLSNFQLKTTDIGFGEEPVLNHRCPRGKAEEAYPARFRLREVRFVFSGRNAGQTKRLSGPRSCLRRVLIPTQSSWKAI